MSNTSVVRQLSKFSKKRTKRFALINVVVIGIAAIFVSSFFYINSLAITSGKTQSIIIGNLPLESSALIYVAEKQGFFKLNGLNVTIRNYENGLTAINALLNSKVDIAGSSEYPLVGMAFQNKSIQTISVINKSELEYLVGRRDHGIENISEISGKKIALPQGTIAEFYLGQFLILNNLKMSNVTLVNMTLSQSADALVNGEVDAIVNWQPYTNSVESSLGSNAVEWSVQSNQQSFGILTCRDEWITKNPELVNHLLKALAQAEEFTNNNHVKAKTIVKEQMNFSDSYMDTVWKQNQFSLSLDQSLVAALENEARWMINNNFTNATAVPDFTNNIYLTGLTSVEPESVNILR